MKRVLLSLVLTSLAVVSVRADLIWYEDFNYTDGPIITTSGGVWARHSGTASPSDAIVYNHRLEVSATGGTLSRQDDVNRKFCPTGSCPYNAAQQLLYASFTVICTNLPGGAAYFANFNNGTTYYGRFYAKPGNLPNTWQIGVANYTGTPQYLAVDLALNTAYQVVVGLNPTGGQLDQLPSNTAAVWVNPINSADVPVFGNDGLTPSSIMQGFAFRQASGFGNAFFAITNLAAANTFDEAATNVWATNAVSPQVVYQPQGTNVYSGEAITLSCVANGQGLKDLTYQWQKNGSDISNPNIPPNVFTIGYATTGDSGSYRVIVTTPYGLSATSSVAEVVVTDSTLPPTVLPNVNTTNYVYAHRTATLQVTASGPPPLSYSWKFNDGFLPGNATGDGTDTLTISDATAAQNDGAYRCEVSNNNGTTSSSNIVLVVTNPPTVSIGYLRTLVDPTTFTATNTTQLFGIHGIVTTATNTTSGNTASYFLQDGTGGINIFVTLGSTWRPNLGDVVDFVGALSTYNGTLELIANSTDPATSYSVLSNNIAALPAPTSVLSWDGLDTNGNAYVEYNVEGRLVMLTDVYFVTNAGTVISTNNLTCQVTNSSGQISYVLFNAAQVNDLTNRTLPSHAQAVVGVLAQYTAGHAGYEVRPTRWEDVLTAPLTISSVSHAGSSSTITWPAVDYTYSYRVLSAGTVAGTYLPIATNTFPDNNGTFTDTGAAGSQKFYRVVSP